MFPETPDTFDTSFLASKKPGKSKDDGKNSTKGRLAQRGDQQAYRKFRKMMATRGERQSHKRIKACIFPGIESDNQEAREDACRLLQCAVAQQP